MPRVRALVCLAVLPLTTLVACGDGPANDLYTYYDDPTSSARAAATPAPATGTPVPTTTSATPDPVTTVTTAAMSADDLAAEEVQPGPVDPAPATTLPDCAVPLGAGTARETSWTYSSGARLTQIVLAGAAAPTAVTTARAALTCKSFRAGGVAYQIEKTTLAALPGATDQLSWCASAPGKATCTVVIATDTLVTAVTVEASTAARAKSAIARVAPKAAEALARGI
ncbi:hypothetical protein [Actinokineospora inagensis]|uniref:hypothetical protein n=1 Tax=Actinokineospora inagensis TaxID=103730 RepID=UPI0003FD385C|nr:hypothetical protein [Actinokineospora inagensis]